MKKIKYPIVLFLFVLSGVAGLIYQVAWFKHLSYFLGNTSYSQAVVLATFMGGLAIGSWWWGKKADTIKRPILLFSLLELAIALYCFFYYPIFEFAKKYFIQFVLTNELESDGLTVLLLKILVSASTILIPTILMGGTLPVLVKFFSERVKDIGKNVSILYFINSLGAVIGTIVAGFYLIQHLGLRNTVYIGALFDFIVAISFLAVVRQKELTLPVNEAVLKKQKIKILPLITEIAITKKQYHLILLIAFISGVSAMIYEVAWLRLLIPILSSTTYSFTIVLTVFILGITIGSFLIYLFMNRIKKPMLFVAMCQVGIILSITLSLPFYQNIPYLIWKAVGDKGLVEYGTYISLQFYYVFLVLIIPTIFMGMSLPVVTKLVVNKIEQSGKEVGRVFALNTIGTVIGSLLAGLICIPYIGILHTIELGLFFNGVGAVVLLLQKEIANMKKQLIYLVVLLSSVIVYFSSVYDSNWMISIMTSEVARKINREKAPLSFDKYIDKVVMHDEILYYKEGVGGTIIVAKFEDEVYLYTNGKGDASSIGDIRTQISLAQTPMILHPSPDSVFVIGFGAGTTIGNVLTHQDVKFAQVAEISPEVIEASLYFEHINEKPLADSRLKVIKDDGISALRLSPYKYDVIISQPSNPWSAGVGNLFTKEFFEDCNEKLRPGGFVAQWFSLYEMDDKSLQLILRTAQHVFGHISMWHIGKSDILFICSNEPFNFDLVKAEERYNSVHEILKKVNINTFSSFLSQEFLSNQQMMSTYSSIGELNSENTPLLELWAPRAYYYNHKPTSFIELDERKKELDDSELLLKRYEREKGSLTMEDYLHIGLFQSTGGNQKFGFRMANKNPYVYVAWAQNELKKNSLNKALEYFTKSLEIVDTITVVYEQMGEIYMRQNDTDRALRIINIALAKKCVNANLYFMRGTLNLMQNDIRSATSDFEKAILLNPNHVDAINNLANSLGRDGKYIEVITVLTQAIQTNPDYAKFYQNRGYAYSLLGKHLDAIKDYTEAIKLKDDYGLAYFSRGNSFKEMGNHDRACGDWKKASVLGIKQVDETIRRECK
jgi:spermidine synthase